MKNAFLTILLGLALAIPALTIPVMAFAQDGDEPVDGTGVVEGDVRQAEVQAEGAAEGTADAAPSPVEEPEPELSAPSEATTPPPTSATTASETDSDITDAEGEAAAANATAGGDETPPEGGGAGMRWDLETSRWVADVDPLPWRNSFFFWSAYVSGFTLAPEAGQTYNPYILQWFTLAPRWYLDALKPSISLRFRTDLFWENASPDSGQIVSFWDPRIGIFDTDVATLPWDIAFGLGVTFRIPVSISSRNCNQILGTQGSFSLTKVLPDVLSGLQMNVSGAGVYTAASTNTCTGDSLYANADTAAIQRRAPTLQTMPNANSADALGQWSPFAGTDFWGTVGLSLSLALTPEISISTSYSGLWYHSRGLAPATVSVDSAPGGTVSLADMSKTKLTVATSFGLSVNWVATNWAYFSLGWTNAYYQQSQLDPSGNWANPFWSPQAALSLFGQFQLDAIYTDLKNAMSSDASPDADEEAEEEAASNRIRARRARADNGATSGRTAQ